MDLFDKLKGKVFLAPMAGVNDLAFRKMCSRYGSSLNFTEMVNVNGVERSNKSTLMLARLLDYERPAGIQLFGTRCNAIKKSVKMLDNFENPDLFDFNFGCPVKRIMNQGAGSALLKRPSKIGEIISIIRDATNKPVSAKIRLGINEKSNNYLKIAKIIENNGADMLIVHGRYQKQGYSGNADWNKIKEIVDSVDIPVVGNGDVTDEKSAKAMLDETGCSYIMLGRATMGNPFIFSRINHFLKTGKMLDQKDRIELFREYLGLAKEYCVKNSVLKQQAMYFTKGIEGSTHLRKKISHIKNIDEIAKLMDNYQKEN